MADSIQQGTTFYSSWSGGKDACLATYQLAQQNYTLAGLLCMMNETGQRSRAHHLPLWVVQQQARALNVPLLAQPTKKTDYQHQFLNALATVKRENIHLLALGDIDLQAHRDWQELQAETSKVTPLFPLWQQPHRELVEQFINAGFEATIIAIKPDMVPTSFLGKPFNAQTIAKLEALSIDVCAEGGEFHTVVTNGPMFSKPIILPLSKATHCTAGDFGYHYLALPSEPSLS